LERKEEEGEVKELRSGDGKLRAELQNRKE